MNHKAVALCLILLATSDRALTAADLVLREAGATLLWGDAASWAQTGEIRRTALTDEIFVESLTGEAALAHFYNLLSRRPEAFREARKALEERGFTPTHTVYVERTIRLAKGPSGTDSESYLPAQTHSESNSDGEIVFWSWDDGNNATWEGEIYMEIYSNGAASTWEGQIDASTDQHPWVYYRKTWERPASDSPPHEVRDWGAPPLPGGSPDFTHAILPHGLQHSGLILPASFSDWAYCWRSCVLAGCSGAAVFCKFSGPGWPACWAIRCVAAEVGCGVGCYFAK